MKTPPPTQIRIARFLARIRTAAGASRAVVRVHKLAQKHLEEDMIDSAEGLTALADALHYRRLELVGLMARDWKLQQEARQSITVEVNRVMQYLRG